MSDLELAKSYSGIGSSVLFAKNQMVVFGDPPNDDLVVEQRNLKTRKPELFKSGVLQVAPSEALENLMGRVQQLTYSDAVAQFSLNAHQIQDFQELNVKFATTHMRMFPHNGKLRIMFFDCTMNDSRPPSRLQVHHIDLGLIMLADFTFTLNSDSFLKLPKDNYFVRIGNNSICSFTPDKKSVQFLFRDQEIHEPFVTFQSQMTSAEIVFSPVPNF